MDYNAMGHRIRLLRMAADLTQEELGVKAGISKAFVGHIERGTRIASLETVVTLAEVLEGSLEYIILGTMPEPKPPKLMTKEERLLNDITRSLLKHTEEWAGDE